MMERPPAPLPLPPPPPVTPVSPIAPPPRRRAFAITPERRAFLNLIRYIQGTWHNGLDSGYRVDRHYYIGAYTINRVIYLSLLEELGISYEACHGSCQKEIYRPEVQDQAILSLLHKNSQLADIDKGITASEGISRAIDGLRSYMLVRPYMRSYAYVFYRRNLLELYQLHSARSLAANAECAPAGSLRCQLKALEAVGKPSAPEPSGVPWPLGLPPPPVPTKGAVLLGDTLLKIAQRYGTSMKEILRLNPGLDKAKLVAGTQFDLPQSAHLRPGPAPGLRPANSGGLTMPEAPQPQLARPAQPIAPKAPQPEPARQAQPNAPESTSFERSRDELVRQGVVSPAERQQIRTGATAMPLPPAMQKACNSGALSPDECTNGIMVRWRGRSRNQASALTAPGYPQGYLPTAAELAAMGFREGATRLPVNTNLKRPGESRNSISPQVKPLSTREQTLLQRIRSGGQAPQWRTYGQCNYDWAGWKLHANGTRTTEADCGGAGMRWTVGVSCDRLLVSRRTTDSGWSNWERPAGPDNKSRQGEDEMVAALCANTATGPR